MTLSSVYVYECVCVVCVCVCVRVCVSVCVHVCSCVCKCVRGAHTSTNVRMSSRLECRVSVLASVDNQVKLNINERTWHTLNDRVLDCALFTIEATPIPINMSTKG